jgi:hypothetical protein
MKELCGTEEKRRFIFTSMRLFKNLTGSLIG